MRAKERDYVVAWAHNPYSFQAEKSERLRPGISNYVAFFAFSALT